VFFAVFIALLLNEFDLSERERERERERETSAKDDATEIFLGSYIFPGKRLSRVLSLSLVLGEWGGDILSCLTPINMWQLMRSKKDF
jgi:hypothetical protein